MFCILQSSNSFIKSEVISLRIDEGQIKSFNNIGYNKIQVLENQLVYRIPVSVNETIDHVSIDIIKESTYNNKTVKCNLEDRYKFFYYTKKERNKKYLVIQLLPIRHQNGSTFLLNDFQWNIAKTATKNIFKAHSRSINNSVLSKGQWFKIGVAKDGIYRLNKSDLDSLGINTNSINPKNIRIFGNEGKMLSEASNEKRPDDLLENAIYVSGESDQSFDDDDYVLFYGDGPDQWEFDNGLNIYNHHLNLYDRSNYYFITVTNGAGKRISNQASESSSNIDVSTFDDYEYHEWDNENFLDSGREFWGEPFEITGTQTFGFNFKNVVESEDVKIYTRTAGRSVVNGMSFKVTYNNAEVAAMSLPMTSIDYTAAYAKVSSSIDSFSVSQDSITLSYKFNKSSTSDKGWLDFIILNAVRELKFEKEQEIFENRSSIGVGNISNFQIRSSNAELSVWDITDIYNIKEQSSNFASSVTSFNIATDTLKRFICFDDEDYFQVDLIGAVANQNLRAKSNIDYIVISPTAFLSQAEELGQLHQTYDGLNYLVADQAEIFNEFSSGRQDPVAIRDFIKHLYDKSLAAAVTPPKYLLLFGDGTYDPLGHENSDNTNFILTYESEMSVDPVKSYVSDDFFGFLDDDEGADIGADDAGQIDIGIGRMPIGSVTEANTMVAKVKAYLEGTYGNWKNNITFVADDEDNNIHLEDAEILAKTVADRYPYMNIDKIYFDAYPQENAAGGERYPDVQKAINNKMFSGSFIVNYTGHGGELGWAHERVLNMSDIRSWTNIDKLPLFMTATCEFSRYDDPSRVSAGELVLLLEDGGAIALMTTVRLVYSFANQNLATNFYDIVLEKNQNPALGDVVRATKNNALAGINNRKFTLLGDPALKLSYPKHHISTSTINNRVLQHGIDTVIVGTDTSLIDNDTLKALSKVEICGFVHDSNALKLNSFNGFVYPTIYDKKLEIETMQNDDESDITGFDLQQNVIYRGKATVTSGDFCFEFVVPKDIGYNIDYGKISYYAENGVIDATGNFDSINVGGTASSFAEDKEGPEMDIYMNDENFAFGGMTDENPILIVKLSDSSGVNTVGNSIGHDLSLTLDDDPERINLNNFYEADLDSYQSGALSYPMSDLSNGKHTVNIKAWDVFNNSSEASTEFVVAASATIALSHVLNYPNPFASNTTFWFEHNRPGELLEVKIQVYTISGKIIKTITTKISSEGFLVNDIIWDGKDEYGDNIGNGVYVYSVEVQSEDGTSRALQFEKLVLLK